MIQNTVKVLCLVMLMAICDFSRSQSFSNAADAENVAALNCIRALKANESMAEAEDSLVKQDVLSVLKKASPDKIQKSDLIKRIRSIDALALARKRKYRVAVDSLRTVVHSYPVVGPLNDTLFAIWSKNGVLSASERARVITGKINKLYASDTFVADSVQLVASDDDFDIVYGDLILMSVTPTDAAWYGQSVLERATAQLNAIRQSVVKARNENNLQRILVRVGLVLAVVVVALLLFFLIGKGYRFALRWVHRQRQRLFRDLKYREYVFLSVGQELKITIVFLSILRWLIYMLVLYFSLPLMFSIFPFSRTWASLLFGLLWNPAKHMMISVWQYMPNLFYIFVICLVVKYIKKLIRYIFKEIEQEKLRLSGFHADWAMPTHSIVRFLINAFMLVLIFPYLPGSESNVFKGVSVLVGVLFSLGSSSAVANVVAGLVITYMRPFQLGDRIRIGEVTGDVVEKSMLVTRVKTIKNEIVTIPNSSVLTGNTMNYSVEAAGPGLIMNTTVTIGYDVPWKDVHKALIDAARMTDKIMENPLPFVLQTSLDDFYVSYQLNAYTRDASLQASIYSDLHQHIQDVFNDRNIEIMSPHYRALRDGNTCTVPAGYLPETYTPDHFRVKVEGK